MHKTDWLKQVETEIALLGLTLTKQTPRYPGLTLCFDVSRAMICGVIIPTTYVIEAWPVAWIRPRENLMRHHRAIGRLATRAVTTVLFSVFGSQPKTMLRFRLVMDCETDAIHIDYR